MTVYINRAKKRKSYQIVVHVAYFHFETLCVCIYDLNYSTYTAQLLCLRYVYIEQQQRDVAAQIRAFINLKDFDPFPLRIDTQRPFAIRVLAFQTRHAFPWRSNTENIYTDDSFYFSFFLTVRFFLFLNFLLYFRCIYIQTFIVSDSTYVCPPLFLFIRFI